MTMNKQPKCEELIDDRLRNRLAQHLPDWDDEDTVADIASDLGYSKEDIREMNGRDTDALRDEHRDRLVEGVLSVEKQITYKVLLSWGGPSDGFEFTFDSEGDLVACWYFYQDWFDGARRRVPPGQDEELAQLFCVGPEFE